MSMVWTMTVFFFGFICGMVFLRLLTSWGEGSPVPRADVKREEKGEGDTLDLEDWDHVLDDLPSFLKRQAE